MSGWTTWTPSDAVLNRLYALLPAVYRERDAAEGYPLRALLRIVGRQAAALDADTEQLYDDLFIETCRAWVIPYVGDLVGNQMLYDQSRLPGADTASTLFTDLASRDLRPAAIVRTRADVAKTIYYRRRKGTPPMLEELARDVTGWPAHVVEFFQLLGWTQHLEHVRLERGWTDVRSVEAMDRVGGAFDQATYTVDVRAPAQREGWDGVHDVGFFLWRLEGYPLQAVPARVASAPWRFHFHPLGHPAPLFSRTRREADPSALATELDVPAPIRRALFYDDLQRYAAMPAPRPPYTALYGLFDVLPSDPTVTPSDHASFAIARNGVAITPAQAGTGAPQVICRRLDPWPAAQPAGHVVAVDVATGRLALGDGFADVTATLDVWFHYGFAADLGGGPYDRRAWLVDVPGAARYEVEEGAIAPRFASVTAALAAWVGDGRPDAVIAILDSRTYDLPATIQLRNEGWLALEADTEMRPLLVTPAGGCAVDVAAPASPGDPERRAALTLSGVVVEGWLHVTGDLGRLRLLHATLVPGRALTEDGAAATTQPSVIVEAGPVASPLNTELHVEAAFAILGPLEVPEHAVGVWLLDSIVDGVGGPTLSGGPGASGPPATIERSTLFGGLAVASLSMSESIATGAIQAVRTQDGCVRFSWVLPGSVTPRRYRCQPDLAARTALDEALAQDPLLPPARRSAIRAEIEGRVRPLFVDGRYGQPGYAQLALATPPEIRTGAEDGAEMGAFDHLRQPQREGNLRIRLGEYLPFGLDAGIVYVT